ncbi:MAG TPA: AAA family ATPase [Chthoniobacterales bacterium]|nr:AAA family ATPase [Chthoniobacterales bacterium]
MSQMTSTNEKPFPRGAEWVRADFHLHTLKDTGASRKQFREEYRGEDESGHAKANNFPKDWIGRLKKEQVRVAVVTNHNDFDRDEYKTLRQLGAKEGILVLPGVELGLKDGGGGIHTLIVFNPDGWVDNAENDDRIARFLSSQFHGPPDEGTRTKDDLYHCLELLDDVKADYFLIFAHVQSENGLFEELLGDNLAHMINGCGKRWRERVLGLQKVKRLDVVQKRWPSGTPLPAFVEGSDPTCIAEVGKSDRKCYLKIGEPSFEAVKFALFDHAYRVRADLPEPRQAVLLRQVSFAGGALEGITVPFSPSLNCLIGPRGNGKSAVIECMRHALGFREGADDRYKSGLVDRMLSPAGKVIVEAVDEFGREVRVERERTGQPSVYLDGQYRDISPGSVLKDILYFGQKDLSARSESFDESFLDKLLVDRLDPKPQEEAALIEGVRQAARQLKETLEATEKIAALQKEKNELDTLLQVFTDKGVDKKLTDMTLFDGDRQAIMAWQQALKEVGTNLKESADWDDADASFPVLKSKRTKPVAADLTAARVKSDEAKATAQVVLQTLREAFTSVGESLQKLAPVQEEMKQEVAKLQKTLNEPQLDLELFRKKKARLDQLVKLLAAGAQRAKTERGARDLLGAAVNKLHDFWRQRFTEREAEVRRLEAELPQEIRLQTVFKGKRRAFGEFLRSKFRGTGLQAASYDTLEDAFTDGRELYQSRAELMTKGLSETAALKVQSTLLEHLADFLSFRSPDETVVLFHQKPLGEYSLGQRATVILHILMHLQRYPVILIDQPEDDLDNETLYSHFIRQLLERKELTQFIFATHNPNIPVLGDAEQAIVCRKEGEIFSFDHGSIDDKDIQQRIITVMEGGEDAFRRRKEIYQLWKNSN